MSVSGNTSQCSYYPMNGDDCVCYAGSDVSGHECTLEDEKTCQWAIKESISELSRGIKECNEGISKG